MKCGNFRIISVITTVSSVDSIYVDNYIGIGAILATCE